MRKVDNPECKVISLIVDADTERCGCIACLDMCVEITHFSRRCGIYLSSRALSLARNTRSVTVFLKKPNEHIRAIYTGENKTRLS